MSRTLPIAVLALTAAAIASLGSRAVAAREPAPTVADFERYALVAIVSGSDADSPRSTAPGLVPSPPDPPRMRPVTGSSDAEWARPLNNSFPSSARGPAGTAFGIPELVLAAYRNAELALAGSMPECGVSWNLLAGIGKVESDHATAGNTDTAGTTIAPILGPALDGTLPGNEVIRAADGVGFVRAVGPMQFLPSTWRTFGTDGNGDGVADPNNVFDAALAAGKYLCADGADLRDAADEVSSVLRYNHSMSYAATVLSWAAAYRNGGVPVQVDVSAERVQPTTFDGTGAITEESPVPDRSDSEPTVSEPTTLVPPAVRAELPTVAAAPEPTRRSPRQTTDAAAPYAVDTAVRQTAVPQTQAPEPTVAASPTPVTPVTVVPSVVVPSLAVPPMPTAVQPGVPQPILTADPQPAVPDPASPETALPDPAVPQTISPQTNSPQTVSPEAVSPGNAEPQPAAPQLVLPQTVDVIPVEPRPGS